MIEANLGFEAQWLSQSVRRAGVKQVVVITEDNGRAGVRSTNEFKSMMRTSFGRLVKERRVRMWDNFVCSVSHEELGSVPEKAKSAMQKQLVDQLRDYSEIIKPSKDPFKPPTRTFSGKRGFGKDDHAIAIQINLFGKRRYFEDSKYHSN